MKNFFVVLRLEKDALSYAVDRDGTSKLIDAIAVKSVHNSEADAQQQVERLNLLGRAHYFWRAGKLLHKVPASQPAPRSSESSPVVGGYWLVGDLATDEQWSLDEQLQSVKTKDAWLLISWISSMSAFQVPSTVWTHLAQWQEVTFSLSLALVKEGADRYEGVPSDILTYIEIVCDPLGVNIQANDFAAAIHGLTATLKSRENQARPHTLYLGRYAANSQVNLHFPRQLIVLLRDHQVSIQGGTIAECRRLREAHLPSG